jgi:hypothetical protein
MRHAGEACFSGECALCFIEIEAVIDDKGACTACEVYEMPSTVRDVKEEDPNGNYDDWFES